GTRTEAGPRRADERRARADADADRKSRRRLDRPRRVPRADARGRVRRARHRRMRLLRVFWFGFRIHFKELSVSPFQIMTAAVWPLVFATLAFLMFRAGSGAPSLLYASLGAAMMGIWSTTSTSAGGAIQRQRWHGLLELLVLAPAPFVVVLAPIAWLLAPTWGMRALRHAALGGPVASALLVCVVLSLAYGAIAVVLLRIFERLARERATLALT